MPLQEGQNLRASSIGLAVWFDVSAPGLQV